MKIITTAAVLGLSLAACGTPQVAQFSETLPEALPETLPGALAIELEDEAAASASLDEADAIWPVSGSSAGLLVADSSGAEASSLDSSFTDSSSLSVAEESDLVFNILAAEIAGQLGLVDVASENYLDAANASNDPRVSERAAKIAVYGSDSQRAELASSRWVELEPSNIEAWRHRAQALIQLEDVDMAVDAIEQVVELSGGESSGVVQSLVDSIVQQSEPEIGVQLLNKLASRYPDSAEMQAGLGRFALSNGQSELAKQAFDSALSLDPDKLETLLALARLQLAAGEDDALEPVRSYVARSPDDLSAHLGYVRLLSSSGKLDDALEQLETVNQRFPDDADAQYSIGLLALDLERPEYAEKYFTAATRLGKHRNDGFFYLGRIADSRSDYELAIERYLAVQGGDRFFAAQMRAAELYAITGEVDQGRRLLIELRSFTDDQAMQVELFNSESRLLISDDRYEESFQLLNDAVEQHPDNPSLLYSRALVAERLGKQELFESDLTNLISIEPDNSHALNALGYFLVNRLERLDEAQEYLEKAHNLSPNDAAIADSLGWLYFHIGRYTDSLRLLKDAYAALPDPEIAAHLGEVLWVSGDQKQAAEVWEEALRDAPDDELINNVMKKYIH